MLRRPVVVRGRPGLLGMAARTAVVAGTATATANAVNNRQSRKQEAAMDQQAAQQQAAEQQQQVNAPPPAAPAAPAGDDMVAKLKQLADLKAAGVLSDEEFTAAKAKLLGA
jgi:hemolysin activation/secretion protein